jgi:hypothetical protein
MLNIAKVRFDLPNIQSISDMRSPLDSNSSIGMGLYDRKGTDGLVFFPQPLRTVKNCEHLNVFSLQLEHILTSQI